MMMRAAAIRSSLLEKSDFTGLAGRTEQLDDDTWLSGSACRSEGADVADFDACRVGQTSTLPSARPASDRKRLPSARKCSSGRLETSDQQTLEMSKEDVW